MSRQAIITQQELNAVADRIRDSGGKLTNRSIYEALGSRGSMGTVTRLFSVWLSNQESSSTATILIPQALQKSLADFVANEVSFARTAKELELATLQESNRNLIEESERQHSTIAEQSHLIENLTIEKALLTGRIGQMGMVVEELRNDAGAQRQAAEAARIENGKAELRLSGIPRLESEIERLREATEAERTCRVDAEQSAAVASARLEKTEAEVADLKSRLARAEIDARDARQEGDKMRQ